MGKHTDFINKKIVTVLEDAVSATSNISDGVEAYPLIGYLLQSIFIQMTGFQEQKFKCIAWEMATENFEFRREFLKNMSKQGFSDYNSKTTLFSKLKVLAGISEIEQDEKQKFINDAYVDMVTILQDSILMYENQQQFTLFVDQAKEEFKAEDICKGDKLFLEKTKFKTVFTKLYDHRNRLAHNSTSYQHNLPTLKELENEQIYDRNYFSWFFCLVLIDNIMIYLYGKFIEKQENELYYY